MSEESTQPVDEQASAAEDPELMESEPEEDEDNDYQEATKLILELIKTPAAGQLLTILGRIMEQFMEARARAKESEAQLGVQRERHRADLEKLRQEHEAELGKMRETNRQAFHLRSLHWTNALRLLGLVIVLGVALTLSLTAHYTAEVATLLGAVAGYLLSKQTEGG